VEFADSSDGRVTCQGEAEGWMIGTLLTRILPGSATAPPNCSIMRERHEHDRDSEKATTAARRAPVLRPRPRAAAACVVDGARQEHRNRRPSTREPSRRRESRQLRSSQAADETTNTRVRG